ncbi:Leucine-rich repeat-containing protein 72 [Larimichthys crocea]|uniref:Uncharacterized protein n=1 Tax=Larimichthys crocea TaxID=215358 RepID=A0ACD3QU14_LARCR|nr:Leucine-rich repeat-containing protein 72 [Larimichthys crocea]
MEVEKIRELSCRSLNCCLTELYLHNNSIKSISGALNHLTCLRLLFLHNNQIRGLDDTMHELRRMQQLQTATFFLNPISHQPGYRHHVIHCLPSLQVLDGKGEIYRHSEGTSDLSQKKSASVARCLFVVLSEVKSAERKKSFQMHSQERHRVLQSVAFCRRAT